MSSHETADGSLPKIREGKSPTGFAARLRDETKHVHREAERTGFIADLIRGRADRRGYALFLRNLVPVYTALEDALETAADVALLAPFRRRDLRRLPALQDDLAAIEAGIGPIPQVLAESDAYARAIRAAAVMGPAALVAHAYARYLGDLSGGQILKPILARALGLDDAMLRFYDFPGLPDAEIAKAGMHDALDTLAPDGSDADVVCAEAIGAFRHNIAVSLAVARAFEPMT